MPPLLDWLLAARPGLTRSAAKGLLRGGRVKVNGTAVSRHDHPVGPADAVQVGPAGATGLRVLFEDAHLIAVDKPAGLLSVATAGEKLATAFAQLRDDLARRRAGRPFVVHRLDRDTSGVLLFAKSPEARDRLQAGWADVKKEYLAITDGTPDPPAGLVENHLLEGKDLRVRVVGPATPGAQLAATRYRVVGSRGRLAAVAVELLTGRKHQIRVHLAGLGCPVAGDPVYGTAPGPLGRLGLHAEHLTLPHPSTGAAVAVHSPPPQALAGRA